MDKMIFSHRGFVDICIIEDDDVDVLVLTRLIEKQQLPYRFMLARTLAQARDLLDNNRFDIILADFCLPDGDIFKLRDFFHEIPVIMITGLGNEGIAASAFKYDISDYLIKDPERNYLKLLPSRIDSILQKKALFTQLSERLKEISCLYKIQKILDEKLPDPKLIQRVMQALSAAMQFPEYVCIEIRLDNRHFCSEGYTPPDSQSGRLQSEIFIKDCERGQISVHYSVTKLFLIQEEQDLISAVAKELGVYWERKEAGDNLRIAAISFESWDSIMILDAYKRIVRVNSSCTKLLGYGEEELYGHDYAIVCVDKAGSNDSFLDFILDISEEAGFWHGEMNLIGSDGGRFPVMSTVTAVKHESIPAEVINFVIIFRDLTPQKNAEREIHNLRYLDGLTSLPNKNRFKGIADRMIKEFAQTRKTGGLLLLDIDHFRILNDVAGHDIGDMVLRQLSIRLMNCIKTYDVAARIEADRFALLIDNLGNDDNLIPDLVQIAEKVRSDVGKVYLVDNKEYHLTVTVGVTLIDSESTVGRLIRQGDAAIGKGKKLGGNRVYFLDPSEHVEIEEAARLEFDLHHMVFDEQLRLYYQIQVDSNNNTVGVEALLRWHHPELGVISPLKFISIAEESPLGLEIGQWVLEKACEQLAIWSGSVRTRYLTMAINIGNRQFHDKGFSKMVEKAIGKYKIDPSLLKLELTEGIVMDHLHAMQQIADLRKLGVQLALDDFGTSYSSLSYLRKINVHQLKIDRSFVQDIPVDDDSNVMTQTIIDLARNFRLQVVAEGVETEDQLKFLKENDCRLFQGYLFGRPVPIDGIEFLLDKYPSMGVSGFKQIHLYPDTRLSVRA